MTKKQVWQTIALDLKRAGNFVAVGNENKADYFLAEAKSLYAGIKNDSRMKKIKKYIKFEKDAEELLLSGSLIFTRI